ncbi:hypothetical protein BDW60DRAFT_201962 [Aspergillus nidulans var. acristatus]
MGFFDIQVCYENPHQIPLKKWQKYLLQMHKWQSYHNHVFNHISYTALDYISNSLIFSNLFLKGGPGRTELYIFICRFDRIFAML